MMNENRLAHCPSVPTRAVAALVFGLLLLVSGCSLTGGSDVDLTDVPVSAGATLSRINAFRAANGLPALTHDPRLDAVSRDMARRIARNDSMKTWAHSPRGLAGRLDRAGYATYAGAENLGAGYVSLDHAMEGWKGSADHRKNLLNKHVTRMGIARVQRPDGRWLNFWVLTLARPVSDGRPTL